MQETQVPPLLVFLVLFAVVFCQSAWKRSLYFAVDHGTHLVLKTNTNKVKIFGVGEDPILKQVFPYINICWCHAVSEIHISQDLSSNARLGDRAILFFSDTPSRVP